MSRITSAQLYARACEIAPHLGHGWSAGRDSSRAEITLAMNDQRLLLAFDNQTHRLHVHGDLRSLKVPDGMRPKFSITMAWSRQDDQIAAEIRRRLLDGDTGYTATLAAATEQRNRALASIRARKELMVSVAANLGVRSFPSATNIDGHLGRAGVLRVQGDLEEHFDPHTRTFVECVRLVVDLGVDEAAEFTAKLGALLSTDEAVQQ